MSAVCHSVALTPCWPVAAEDVVAQGKRQPLWTNSLVFIFIVFAGEFLWEGKADALQVRLSVRGWKCIPVGENRSLFNLAVLYHCHVDYISFFAHLFLWQSFRPFVLFLAFLLLNSPDVDPLGVDLAAGIDFSRPQPRVILAPSP